MAALTVKKGDTLRAVFSFTENGAPANLSGCTARMHVRAKRALTLVLSASTETGKLTIDGIAGTVTAVIPKESMEAVATGKYQADVELTYADGNRRSSDTFTVTVVQDMTYSEAAP